MDNSGKPGKTLLFALYFLLLAGICTRLFFEKQFNAAFSSLKFWGKETSQTLTVGFAEQFLSLDPLANDTGSRARLLHFYEGLVKVTPDLQIEPALAVSYGSLDDLTWEFRLRPNVYFHNGKQMVAEDVIASLNDAKNNPKSGVKDLASTIKSVKKIDDGVIQIITNSTDPLLLQKLSAVLIYPKERGEESFAIGTGPYKLEGNNTGVLLLKRFDKYWGDVPRFESVTLKTIGAKDQKSAVLKNGEVDILANLPADIASNFAFKNFDLKTLPSLEVNFLMFNFDGIFKEKALRQAVALGLRTDQLSKLAQGFAARANQFAGNGIFGYDPSIKSKEANVVEAKNIVMAANNNQRVSCTLDLPSGLELFGESVKEQLGKIGIDVKVKFLSSAELGKKIVGRESEFFFFGWKFDLGDALDFLTAVVHSQSGSFGQFNGGNYKNQEVDLLIEQAGSMLKSQERLLKMREVMKKITDEDIIGIPLFSPEVLYGVSKDIKWTPRVDGYVLAQEVKMW